MPRHVSFLDTSVPGPRTTPPSRLELPEDSTAGTSCPRPPKRPRHRVTSASELQAELFAEDSDDGSISSSDFDARQNGWPSGSSSSSSSSSDDSDKIFYHSDSDTDSGGVLIESEANRENSPESVPEPSVSSFAWSDASDFVPHLHPFQRDSCGVTEDWPCNDQARESDYFRAYLDMEVMSFIAEKTNANYRSESEQLNDNTTNQRARKWRDTRPEELYVMFALMFLMPLCKKHVLKHYWRHDPIIDTPVFRTYMARDRFLLLLSFLHFADNENPSHHDRLWKVRDILSMLFSRYSKFFYPFQKLVIDESLMLYKGRLIFKQYIPSKRHRFGIKLFVLCDCETGIVLDMLVYTATDLDIPKARKDDPMGMSGAIVKKLMAPYMGKGHILYTDNWYTSPALCQFLYDSKTGSCGTVRTNRKFMPKFNGQKTRLSDPSSSDKDTDATHSPNERRKTQKKGRKKKDRFIQKEKSGKIIAVKFNDKRAVHLLSSVHKGDTVNTGKKHYRTKKPIKKPDVVVDYTQNMRLIDKCDSQLSQVECLRKTVTWYKKLFLHILDVTMLNAYNMWLVTKGIEPTKKLKLREFQYNVAFQLLEEFGVIREQRQGRRQVYVLEKFRLMGSACRHYPSNTEMRNGKKRRLNCYVCSNTNRRPQKRSRVSTMCRECDVGLCTIPCFGEFHSLKEL